MALPDRPLIMSRAERIQLLMRIARGEMPDHEMLDDGRIIEVAAPMDVRAEAVADLRAMGVTNVPDLSETHAN